MCLSTVYRGTSPDPENKLAEYVVGVDIKGANIHLTSITGEELDLRGAISHIDLVSGKIFLSTEVQPL